MMASQCGARRGVLSSLHSLIMLIHQLELYNPMHIADLLDCPARRAMVGGYTFGLRRGPDEVHAPHELFPTVVYHALFFIAAPDYQKDLGGAVAAAGEQPEHEVRPDAISCRHGAGAAAALSAGVRHRRQIHERPRLHGQGYRQKRLVEITQHMWTPHDGRRCGTVAVYQGTSLGMPRIHVFMWTNVGVVKDFGEHRTKQKTIPERERLFSDTEKNLEYLAKWIRTSKARSASPTASGLRGRQVSLEDCLHEGQGRAGQRVLFGGDPKMGVALRGF